MPDDPQASLRAELLGQIVGARFAIEGAIAELARSGGNTAGVQNQMQALAQLQRSIGTASLSDLAAMRGEIAAAVTQTHAVIEQGRAASGGVDADSAALTNLASRAQTQAASFMRDLRQYDDLLHFDSEEQERAYRQREEDYRKRHEAGLAQGGPEGALQASGAAFSQSVDLAAHGASADPALMRRVDELAASTAALRAGIIRDGGDVSKFDADMRADLRAIMKSKGKTDAEIDTLLAAHPENPIDAMKAFVAGQNSAITERDLQTLDTSIRRAVPATAVVESNQVDDRRKSDAIAKLAGLKMADHPEGEDFAHGITIQEHAASNARGAG